MGTPRPGYPPPPLLGRGLTPRELEVLLLVARGRRNDEVGDELGICNQTAKNHLRHIYVKLGARNRVEAANWLRGHS